MNGVRQSMDAGSELGKNVYSTDVVVPSKSTVTVRLELAGKVALGNVGGRPAYRLDLWSQPMINPETLTVHVRGAEDATIADNRHLALEESDGELSRQLTLFSPTGVTASLARR